MAVSPEYIEALRYLERDPLHSNHHPCDMGCVGAAIENMRREKRYNEQLQRKKEEDAKEN